MIRSRTGTGLTGAALFAGVLATMSGLLAAPAAADVADAVNALSISYDGVSFSDSPEGSLFAADGTLVPGSSVSTTIHVRNDSKLTGELQLAVTGATASNIAFLESLSMMASLPGDAVGVPIRLEAGEQCSPLLAGEELAAGATVAVTITLTMDGSVGNDEQRSTAGAELLASLREPGAPGSAVPGCEEGTGIPVLPEPAEPDETDTAEDPDLVPAIGLPSTGAAVGLSPWIGVSAIVAGTAIFLISRHRKRLEER